MFLTIFVKKSFFFMAKKFFDAIFFVEVTKKNEKSLYQMKVGIKFGKVKKFGIGWCILHRMAADNAKGGSVRTPPPYGIGLIRIVLVRSKLHTTYLNILSVDTASPNYYVETYYVSFHFRNWVASFLKVQLKSIEIS